MIDMHVHTRRCRHASGMPLEYVAQAEAAGLSALAFTDHLPMLDGSETEYAMSWSEMPEYVAEVEVLKDRAAHPEVLLGIEADWSQEHVALLREALSGYDFDVVLGSVHFIDGWAFDDPSLTDRYAEWDIDALWMRYFNDIADAARSGLFDVMAHPDLVKKFKYLPSFDPEGLYEEAAAAFAASGVTVEVNTAGLRKPIGEIYPAGGFLAACRRAGVPATMGSDAHRPEEVGCDFDLARAALSSAGYDSVVVHRGRVAREVRL